MYICTYICIQYNMLYQVWSLHTFEYYSRFVQFIFFVILLLVCVNQNGYCGCNIVVVVIGINYRNLFMIAWTMWWLVLGNYAIFNSKLHKKHNHSYLVLCYFYREYVLAAHFMIIL